MSLVAAYESSEDEEEESQSIKTTDELSVEDLKAKKDSNEESYKIDILDEEDWSYTPQSAAVKSVSIFSNLPLSNKENISYEEEKDDEFLKIKATVSDEIKPDCDNVDNREKDKTKFMNLPQPVKGGKKGKVKILLPTYTSGNDSEDEVDSKQIVRKDEEKDAQFKKRSSLFTVLPKPKYSVSVGENKNKVFQKQVNRQLVPHTLKKPLVIDKPQLEQIKNGQLNKQEELSEDEEVIDDGNFFSLGDNFSNEKNDSLAVSVENNSSSKDLSTSRNSLSQSTLTVQKLCHSSNLKDNESSLSLTATSSSQVPKKENSYFSNLFAKNIISDSTNPIKTNSPNSSASENSSKMSFRESLDQKQIYSDVTAPYGSTEFNSTTLSTLPNLDTKYVEDPQIENKAEPFFAYGYQKTYDELESVSAVEPVDVYSQSNVDAPLDKDAIKALVGGKRKFRKEDINIIDVRGEDLQLSKGEYLKNLTQDSGYRPKVSKNNEPRKLEKRKHQITYLAYQAKEREHELRQAWSISKATRRDTQSKYGF